VQGIKISEVTDWLLSHVDGLAAPLRFELISGGRSNLTYAVTSADGRKIVLRRPPVSHVLSTAHDMAREYRVISALRDTDVPVAPALAFCADEAVNDRPFYLMELSTDMCCAMSPAPKRCSTRRKEGSPASSSLTCWPRSTGWTSTR